MFTVIEILTNTTHAKTTLIVNLVHVHVTIFVLVIYADRNVRKLIVMFGITKHVMYC